MTDSVIEPDYKVEKTTGWAVKWNECAEYTSDKDNVWPTAYNSKPIQVLHSCFMDIRHDYLLNAFSGLYIKKNEVIFRLDSTAVGASIENRINVKKFIIKLYYRYFKFIK